MDMQKVGERILLSRRRMMTQTTLGQSVGLSQARISELERGDGKGIDLSLIEQIALVLGVSPQYLAGWVDDPLYEVEEDVLVTKEAQRNYNATTDPTMKELLELIEGMTPGQRQQMAGIAKLLLGGPTIIE